ncbi:MAG: FAD:protein FMN transferase [Deltaproteobacteria bacterium]|nr:FAD:protein FMN transferase [Deltaproteobacteria bacterium]
MANHTKGRIKKLAGIAATIFVFIIIALAVYNKRPSETKYTRLLMGTVVEITLVGGDETGLTSAADAAFDEMQRLEHLLSRYRDDSDVARINRAAGKEAAVVSKETMDVIEASLKVSQYSHGAFDITMGVLGNLWHFTADDRGAMTPPPQQEAAKLLPLIDYRRIIIDKKNSTVKLARPGMKIDLGGIAKGYIVGRAVDVLKRHGIKKGIVHAGGDMVVFQEPDDEPWLIGIQDPRNKDRLIGTIKAYNTAISTSGDYERFFIKDGVRYHHIMDPSTGFPANKCRGVTIVAKDSTMADALSTAIFVLGPDDGMKLIEKLPDAQGLIIDANGRITVSAGLKGKVIFLKQ